MSRARPRFDQPPLPVEAIVQRARDGCLKSYEELVRRHQGLIYSFLLCRTGSAEDAEDLAQETFLRAWAGLRRFDASRKLSTWLLAIANREEAGARRRRRRRQAIDACRTIEPPPTERPPEERAISSEEHRSLRAAMEARLSREERSALWLRYAAGLSIAEVARVLGRSTVATRVMLFRSRERILPGLRPPAPARTAIVPGGDGAHGLVGEAS